MTIAISGMTAAPGGAASTDLFEISRPGTPSVTYSVSAANILRAAADGTALLPTIGSASDPNTGLYSIAGDQLGFSTGGTLRFDISTTAVTSTLPMVLPATGSVSATVVNFGTAESGLFGNATSVSIATAGVLNLTVATQTSGAGAGVAIAGGVRIGGAGVAQLGTTITYGVNQTSTASFAALRFDLGLVVGGTDVPVFGSGGGFFIDARTNSTSVFQVTSAGSALATDSAAAPGFSWIGATNKGMYNQGTNQIGWAIGGARKMQLDSIGTLQFSQNAGISQTTAGASTWIAGNVTSTALFSAFAYNLTSGYAAQAFTGGAGISQGGFQFAYTVNQTSTAAFTALDIAVTETAVGSGAQYIINAKAGAAGTTQAFAVTNVGAVLAGNGTNLLPAYSFVLDPTSGWFRSGANQVALALAGGTRFTFQTAAIVGAQSTGIWPSVANTFTYYGGNITTSASAAVQLYNLTSGGTVQAFTGSTTAQIAVQILPTVNQTSTAGFTALDIAVTETATGSGAQYLINAKAGAGGATQKFSVRNNGGVGCAQVSATLGAGNTDDYAGIGTYGVALLTSNGAGSVLRGIVAPVDGRLLTICHIAGLTLTINNQDAGSAAANRIITNSGGTAIVMAAGSSIELVYDLTAARWRVTSYNA